MSSRLRLLCTALAVGPILLASASTFNANAGPQERPTVISASVPLYPRVPQLAHIEGPVRLIITTNGKEISTIAVKSGQPMLAQAATENVKTWRFEQHRPTTFDITFNYRLLPSKCDSECNCSSSEPGTVLLRLPNEVEVSAKELLTCDPAIEKKH